MSNYLIQRLATIIPTLFFVSILIFGLQQLLPGDPAMILAGEERDPTVIAHLREKLHLDQPLPVRYLYWAGGVLRGDLGESQRIQKPVLDLVAEKLPVTIELATLAILIALSIGITAGVISAVAKDAGFDVKIQSTEFATSLNMADKGDFEVYVLAWSGRADPDGNLYSFNACKQPLNYSGYCVPEVDALLDRSRSERDPAERKKAYEQIATILIAKDRPDIYLFHRHWLWAYTTKLSGLRTIPDGLVRVQGLKLN